MMGPAMMARQVPMMGPANAAVARRFLRSVHHVASSFHHHRPQDFDFLDYQWIMVKQVTRPDDPLRLPMMGCRRSGEGRIVVVRRRPDEPLRLPMTGCRRSGEGRIIIASSTDMLACRPMMGRGPSSIDYHHVCCSHHLSPKLLQSCTAFPSIPALSGHGPPRVPSSLDPPNRWLTKGSQSRRGRQVGLGCARGTTYPERRRPRPYVPGTWRAPIPRGSRLHHHHLPPTPLATHAGTTFNLVATRGSASWNLATSPTPCDALMKGSTPRRRGGRSTHGWRGGSARPGGWARSLGLSRRARFGSRRRR
jgi:hypothetical protein